jgi:hypothetical protein
MPDEQDTSAYLKTVDRLEPDMAVIDSDAALTSIAISLKRIAHILESRNFVKDPRV